MQDQTNQTSNTQSEQINNEEIKNLTSIILKLSPFEFTTVGTILGYLISFNLTITEQNSVGNWFELVGQVILTFNAQGSASLPPSPKQFEDLKKQVDTLQNLLFQILSTKN